MIAWICNLKAVVKNQAALGIPVPRRFFFFLLFVFFKQHRQICINFELSTQALFYYWAPDALIASSCKVDIGAQANASQLMHTANDSAVGEEFPCFTRIYLPESSDKMCGSIVQVHTLKNSLI